jgi:hypothetical protein
MDMFFFWFSATSDSALDEATLEWLETNVNLTNFQLKQVIESLDRTQS